MLILGYEVWQINDKGTFEKESETNLKIQGTILNTTLYFAGGYFQYYFLKAGPNRSFILINAQNRTYIYKLVSSPSFEPWSLAALSRCLIQYAMMPHILVLG